MSSSNTKKKTRRSTSVSVSRKTQTRRTRKRPQNNVFVLRLLLLVVLVLVVFEGRLIHTMFTQHLETGVETVQLGSDTTGVTAETAVSDDQLPDEEADNTGSGGEVSPAEDTVNEQDDPAAAQSSSGSGNTDTGIVGLAGFDNAAGSLPDQAAENDPYASDAVVSEVIDSPAVVKEQSVSVDDFYFNDAVFIGDSRMEGFRNTSGITQGDFLTSVGMSLTSIQDTTVNTSYGTITVYQGLTGKQYGKIYLMLGTNDLGYYPMDNFLNAAEKVLTDFHQFQPNAIIYICSVIYVEEAKVETDYINNANVIEVNRNLVQACEDLDYCHYINLNEIFSDGHQSLISDASQDGVHLFGDYPKMMLDYLKSHYIQTQAAASGQSGSGSSSTSS